jgi:hypothetical protein
VLTAQQQERAPRIGVLLAFAEDDPESTARLKNFDKSLSGSDTRLLHAHAGL